MKHYLFLFSCLFLVFCSCEKDNKEIEGKEVAVKATVKNFEGFLLKKESNDPHETVAGYHKFSFSKGGEVAQDAEDWDLAFNRTTIIVNGGKASQGEPTRTGKGACYITEGILDEVTVNADDFVVQDVPKKWYTYNAEGNHVIRPIPGKVIVVRTHDGKYAKMVIKSYYKNSDVKEDPRYYTFDYIYN